MSRARAVVHLRDSGVALDDKDRRVALIALRTFTRSGPYPDEANLLGWSVAHVKRCLRRGERALSRASGCAEHADLPAVRALLSKFDAQRVT